MTGITKGSMFTSLNNETMTLYHGYEIIEVYRYTSGVSDFEVFKGDSERGIMIYKKTLEEVKQFIDSL